MGVMVGPHGTGVSVLADVRVAVEVGVGVAVTDDRMPKVFDAVIVRPSCAVARAVSV